MLISAVRLFLVAVAAGGLLWSASHAAAQYPPPIGSVSAGASDTTPDVGSNVNVTCTVLNSSGSPVANQPCTFTIASQPGGASFGGAQSAVSNTDANGIATAVLSTGATSGTIVVSMESGGILSQVTLSTGAPQGLPGTGGAPAQSNVPWETLAGAALLGVALAGALVALGSRRRSAD